MEINNSNNSDFKGKHDGFDNSSRAGTSSACNAWQDKGRDRKLSKKRERSPDKEWGRAGSMHGKSRDSVREDEIKESNTEEKHFPPSQQCQMSAIQMQPTPSTVTYDCNGFGTSDFYVDPNQRNYPMATQFNMYNAMNHQWAAGNLPVNSGMPLGTGMEMPPNTGMNPFPFVMPNDPSMFAMMPGMTGYGPFPIMNNQENLPPKTIVNLTNCVLYPPPPGAPAPSRRERPPGCKTVFVGGLPEKVTEEIVREAFGGCGEISTIRMSKKNFCHVRFTCETYVDKALCFSGYRVKIENKDETAYSGRLHVDFAVARDDQYEFECYLRAMQREARHRERSENAQPPTPPPVVHYSETEATMLGEKLRNEESFKNAVQILITWLEKGECSKRNAGSFYSMIQSTNSHVRRLMNEKAKLEEEVRQAKAKLNQKCASNQSLFTDIEKVFDTAALQKVWDHFTKAQRKNLEMWRKQTKEIKESNLGDLISDRIEDEMEVSDGEDDVSQIISSPGQSEEELSRCREEIELLRTQLRGAENEVVLVRNEGEETANSLRETNQKLQLQFEESKKMLEEAQKLVKEKSGFAKNEIHHLDSSHTMSNGSCRTHSGVLAINENETRLVTLIATFLNVHPFGASIDYICSYLVKMDPSVNARDVESLLKKIPTVFKEESTGIGATLEKKWTFLGFKI